MATRRRRTSRRTTRRTVRRRPKLATTLGSVAALALMAFYSRVGWPWRIGATVAITVALVGYYLWSHSQIEGDTDDRTTGTSRGGDR